MSNQLELDWLSEERPAPLPLDPSATARARAELLSHAAAGSARRSRPALRGLRRGSLRVAVSGVALGAFAGAALLVTQSGGPALNSSPGSSPGTGSSIRSIPAVRSASAKRLNHLSVRLAADTAPIGDATLVLRTDSYPDGSSITGADLYTDSGNYFYAPTLAGLPALIKANETVNNGAPDQEQRDSAAALAALSGPIDTARQQMSIANLDPGVKPTMITPGEAIAQRVAAAPVPLRQQIEQKFKQVAANDAAQDIQSLISQENGMIWDNSFDALLAGAGNPQVRAGVLALLATIPQIQVTQGTLNGQPTLVITAALLSSKSGTYQEQLILDANTGVPVEFIGGNVGQTPSVTTAYTITRVTVADIENGSYTG